MSVVCFWLVFYAMFVIVVIFAASPLIFFFLFVVRSSCSRMHVVHSSPVAIHIVHTLRYLQIVFLHEDNNLSNRFVQWWE